MTDLQTPDYVDMLPLPPAIRGRLLAHYEWVGEWIAANFERAPLVAAYYAHGLGGDATYSGAWHQALPATVPPVDVLTSGGHHRYPGCVKNALLWLVHKGAVGFGSWTPTADDPDAVRYARMLFRPNRGVDDATLRTALRSVRSVLQTIALDAVPVLEGRGAALFIPFAGAPSYEAVRTFLINVVLRAAAIAPDTIVPERKPREEPVTGRIELTIRSNAPGRFSSLPYTLLGGSQLSMATPVAWEELEKAHAAVNEAEVGVRLQRGDVFAQLAKPLAKQRFSAIPAAMRVAP